MKGINEMPGAPVDDDEEDRDYVDPWWYNPKFVYIEESEDDE